MAFPTGWPTPPPDNTRSIRFFKTGTATADFSDKAWVFSQDTGVYHENPDSVTPEEDGVELGPFEIQLANTPLSDDVIIINWAESGAAKVATLTDTSTVGGTNAANIGSASVNRTTGVMTVTFAALHPPDEDSIVIDYRFKARSQAYAGTIAIKATVVALEYSFDGFTVDGTVAAGETIIFRNRYEGCIAVRGNTCVFTIQAW